MHGGAFQSPDTALVGDGVCIWPGVVPGTTSHIPASRLLACQSWRHLGITKSNSCKVQRG